MPIILFLINMEDTFLLQPIISMVVSS